MNRHETSAVVHPADLSRLSDEALMARIADRDGSAFTELFNRYHPLAYSFDYRILQNQADALDAVQEKFLAVWRASDQYQARPGSTVRNYILKIDRNVCLGFIRRAWRRRETGAEADSETTDQDWSEMLDYLYLRYQGDCPATPEDAARDTELRGLMATVLDYTQAQFSPAQFAAFWGFIQGKSYKEIAAENGARLDSVRGLIARGFKRLRDEFGQRWEAL